MKPYYHGISADEIVGVRDPQPKSPEKDSELWHVKRVAEGVEKLCNTVVALKQFSKLTDQEIKTAIKIVTDKAL